ncbi:methyl-accepting chemotaxis protein [Vibrio sp. ZSDE26]|uniref:Methyl-accepting chemotaxis protein n=1 Tax=Vibrio amylolyticus TaxID=2847292 RepID=A0A9X1XKN7_9VIBR|nr:methyl-accepting chemotaxis protein [Vibrio amylolyticus]MCK6263925.1 methyl-accepting chemotaxis protein [Vibrio amylolyticus]
MSLKYKLLIILLIIGLTPALIISTWSLYVANKNFEKQTFSQLIALREVKKSAVIEYLNTRVEQANSLANNQSIIDATTAFSNAFNELSTNYNVEAESGIDRKLANYYRDNFISTLIEKSPNTKGNVTALQLTRDISPSGKLLQLDYIVNNQAAVGSKDSQVRSGRNSKYDEVHAGIHPYLNDLLDRFGYYDIFLLDIDTGNIIYSVFKEVDYGTSMIDGPYANSGLAKAFQKAKSADRNEGASLVDFTPYLPSYNAPAGFIAVPVYDNGLKVGVLAFQFPIDRLNMIMSERSGLGETGETYLVGGDKLMRSDSYLDPTNRSVNASFAKPETGSVNTESVKKALNGEAGIGAIYDYNNTLVLSAYEPLNVHGLNWAIITEIDEKEACAAFYDLRDIMLTLAGVVILFIVIIAMVIARSIMKPLGGEPSAMQRIASNIASGDLSEEFEIHESAGGVYLSMHQMANSLKEMLMKISDAALQQSNASQQLTKVTSDTDRSVNQQRQNTDQVANAMNELSTTVAEVTKSTNEAAEASILAQEKVTTSYEQVTNVSAEIRQLSDGLNNSREKITRLNSSAENISNILTTITSISERTNLLALNAAIEAARAGEQGRGFAVVADEVRSLASSTKESSEEVSQMIAMLQRDATETRDVMEHGIEHAEHVANYALKTTESLKVASESVDVIADITTQIATVAEEQNSVTEEINRNIQEISLMSIEAERSVHQISESSGQLDELSNSLEAMVGEFKVETR